MKIFLMAGHTPKGVHQDPGAVGNNYREADLTMELRDLAADLIRAKGVPIFEDNDTMRLVEVLAQVSSSEKDIVCDIHFNAGPASATGVEVVIPERHTKDEEHLASIIAVEFAEIMGVKNRGVITEDKTARHRLGVMRPAGCNVLVEVCFISNAKDIQSYQANKSALAGKLADILTKQLQILAAA